VFAFEAMFDEAAIGRHLALDAFLYEVTEVLRNGIAIGPLLSDALELFRRVSR
jgi:hypothetical protein